jgi:hypothetical protein
MNVYQNNGTKNKEIRAHTGDAIRATIGNFINKDGNKNIFW